MVLSFGPHKQLDKEKQVVNIVWLNEQKIHWELGKNLYVFQTLHFSI